MSEPVQNSVPEEESWLDTACNYWQSHGPTQVVKDVVREGSDFISSYVVEPDPLQKEIAKVNEKKNKGIFDRAASYISAAKRKIIKRVQESDLAKSALSFVREHSPYIPDSLEKSLQVYLQPEPPKVKSPKLALELKEESPKEESPKKEEKKIPSGHRQWPKKPEPAKKYAIAKNEPTPKSNPVVSSNPSPTPLAEKGIVEAVVAPPKKEEPVVVIKSEAPSSPRMAEASSAPPVAHQAAAIVAELPVALPVPVVSAALPNASVVEEGSRVVVQSDVISVESFAPQMVTANVTPSIVASNVGSKGSAGELSAPATISPQVVVAQESTCSNVRPTDEVEEGSRPTPPVVLAAAVAERDDRSVIVGSRLVVTKNFKIKGQASHDLPLEVTSEVVLAAARNNKADKDAREVSPDEAQYGTFGLIIPSLHGATSVASASREEGDVIQKLEEPLLTVQRSDSQGSPSDGNNGRNREQPIIVAEVNEDRDVDLFEDENILIGESGKFQPSADVVI